MNTIKLNTIGEVFAKGGGQQGGEKTIFDCSKPEDIEKLYHRLDALLVERGENADISECGIVVLKPLNNCSALVSVVAHRNDQTSGISITFKCYDASSGSADPYGVRYGAQYNTQGSVPTWRIYNASIG